MIARLKCWLRRNHNPVRHPLGGFKCADCGLAERALDDFKGGEFMSHVSPLKKYVDRKDGSFTRVLR
jgi:hypothetical protein